MRGPGQCDRLGQVRGQVCDRLGQVRGPAV